jgi:branched-chain amino acid transport system substrate-binding protein
VRSVEIAVGALALALAAGAVHAQDVSDDAVRIGVLNDQSGTYADFGGPTSVIAAEMAVEDFGGEVLGRPIEVLGADHQNKADVGSTLARAWFDVEGVDMVTDLTNSAVALAVQELARDKNRIAIFSGPATTTLTGEACSPTGVHWTFDTYSQAVATARAVVEEGGERWFVITADYAFGHQMQEDITRVVEEMGGEVVGAVRHPLATTDFASFLLTAQGSGADIIGLANAGGDTINAIKQAGEFGLTQAGQKLVGLVVVISDIHALGLEQAQGLRFTTAFYWDADEETRAWSRRFEERTGRMPGMVQAGVYSAVLHYLKAVEAAGTDAAEAVMTKMRELPIDDAFADGGHIREDGRMVHDMYLVEVKSPQESKGAWDYLRILRRIPGEQAFQPLAESECPLVTG